MRLPKWFMNEKLTDPYTEESIWRPRFPCHHVITVHFVDAGRPPIELACVKSRHGSKYNHYNAGWEWGDNALLHSWPNGLTSQPIQSISHKSPQPWVMYGGDAPVLHKDDSDKNGTPLKPAFKRISKKEKRKVGQSLDDIIRSTE